ncbi:PHO85 cyclin-5 [Basidiobolus ranarum]|uniref:PHO85 cyclin-5 n=1 Tax=Basidiobolus ranarum TaxID=34480 RepID=A0ABR2VZY5_9FUNG
MSVVASVNNFTFNFNNSCSSNTLTSNTPVVSVVNSTLPVATMTTIEPAFNSFSHVHSHLPSSHPWPSWPSSTTPVDVNSGTVDSSVVVEDSFDVLNYASMTTPKKIELVRDLIDVTADILGNIWGKNSTENNVLPLNIFVQETIKRSQSSYCTLLTALLYVFRIKDQILKLRKSTVLKSDTFERKPIAGSENDSTTPFDESFMDRVLCARRMFLSALILASKFLQDRNYTNGAWAKTLGLNVADININENVFLRLIDYRLFVSLPIFTNWSNTCMKFVQTSKAKRNASVKPAGQALHAHKHRIHAHSGPYPTGNPTIQPQELAALLRLKAQKHREMLNSLTNSNSARFKQFQSKPKHICQLPSPSASP